MLSPWITIAWCWSWGRKVQVPILSGIRADGIGEFRRYMPRNYLPVMLDSGISKGFLRPYEGIVQLGTSPGEDRGAINWNGTLYRVSGSKLTKVNKDGVVTTLAEVGGAGQTRMAYSFDRLAIPSDGSLFYWDGSALVKVTDADLGVCLSVCWTGGYFITTDGTSIIATDLTNPTSVNPLRYGSAESDPDPLLAVATIRNEVYGLGRYTIEAFRNVGTAAGDVFPFARIDGAQVPKGIIGTHAFCEFLGSFAFIGSGRDESPSVYVMLPGDTQSISTREVDTVLQSYTEAQLSEAVVEARVDKQQAMLMVHLPDQCLVYDTAASKAIGEPVWFTLDSGIVDPAQYRGRGLVWCYDQWNVGDPTSAAVGVLSTTTAQHFGQVTGWDFGTLAVYNEGDEGIIHEMELIGLPGRVDFGADPVIWTSYSHDGETWSQEKAIKAGKQGERQKRLMWREQGGIRAYRMQRFRGTSDARIPFARLEMAIEPLFVKAANRG